MLKPQNIIKPFSWTNCFLFLLAAVIAVGLKYHYSRAGGDDLVWILRPTAGVIELITGIHFEKEAGAGFVNMEKRIIIEPSCAGVNFLIIAFCMSFFTLRPTRASGVGRKMARLGVCMAGAYFLTIIVNSVRIVLSIQLQQADIYSGLITSERVHRFEGVMVYFISLCAYYFILLKIRPSLFRRAPDKRMEWSGGRLVHSGFVPLAWYSLIALAAPLLNNAWRGNPTRFLEHCLVVLSVCAGILLLIHFSRLCFRRMAQYGEGATASCFRSRKERGRNKPGADLVVVNGDVTRTAKGKEYEEAKRFFESLNETLKGLPRS